MGRTGRVWSGWPPAAHGAHENEWQGWYFEARAREVLNEAFTPGMTPSGPVRQHDLRLLAQPGVGPQGPHEIPIGPGRVTSSKSRGHVILNDERPCGTASPSKVSVSSSSAVRASWTTTASSSRGTAPKGWRGKGRGAVEQWRVSDPESWLHSTEVDAFWIEDSHCLEQSPDRPGTSLVRPIGRQPPRSMGRRDRPGPTSFR